MLSGAEFPQKAAINDYDFIYIPSNCIHKIAVTSWHVKPQKILTTYYGITDEHFKYFGKKNRDLKKIVYLSHPSKGLDSAIAVFRILREEDPGFTLHVYGGNKLWGEQESVIAQESGLVYHGLVGQKELAHRLQKIGFSLNLQSREEPFGMVVTESMRAGCIVLASPVGAYPEFVKNGFNGFLIPGDHTNPQTHEKAARLILQLIKTPDYMDYIRHNAINTPFSWQTIAKSWEGHWDWHLKGTQKQNLTENIIRGCSQCGGNLLPLADGLHCVDCGTYQQSFEAT
jgi:glycosyltransferase involved in cell wall biosynthesis